MKRFIDIGQIKTLKKSSLNFCCLLLLESFIAFQFAVEMVCLPKSDEPNPETKAKILQFEAYVDNVLTVELQKHHKNFHSKEADMQEWLQLKRMIATMQEQNLPGFKGKINLGSNIYLPVEVPDTSKMILNLGSGVYVEMSLEDALDHIHNQVSGIERELSYINECMASLKARIQVIVQSINELDNLR